MNWDPDSRQPNPLVPIIEKLKRGRQAERIQLLEFLLSHRPNDPVVLYNLGLALSDAGRVERAEKILRRASDLDPTDVNIKVALGVALGRLGQESEAEVVLRAATAQDLKNPWAHRNLGAILLKSGKAEDADSARAQTQVGPVFTGHQPVLFDAVFDQQPWEFDLPDTIEARGVHVALPRIR